MRAIAVADLGAAPTLTDLPTPKPAAGEVLVRVQTSSVNGFDGAVVAGWLQGMMEHRFPVVLGKDFAGTVAAVGEGVTRFAVGDAVFGVVTKSYLGDGGFGEYVSVSEQVGIAALPPNLDLTAAGALGLAGTAAVNAVDALDLRSGQTVLISGATGGVGAIAIQYATAAGAQVIATARPGEETDFVRGLGAAHVVDHTGDLPAQMLSTAPQGVDAVVHLAGDPAMLAGLLADHGRLASTLGFGPDQHPAATAVMANPDPATLDRLADDVATGRIRVPVTATFHLVDVPAALTAFAGGTLGKLGVTVA
jgi:NADPH:quinone reductase-like Zn-dependent oxidoreductase